MSTATAEPTRLDDPPAPRRKARRKGIRLQLVTTPLIVLAVVGLWKLYVELSGISPFVLPAPEDVAVAFVEQITTPAVWTEHIWTTFYETIAGFTIGIAVGTVLGFLMGRSPTLNRILGPFVITTQVVPKVALVPLFILWFGFGPSSKVMVAAMLSFFPILTNTAFGVRSVPAGMREMMRTVGASRWESFRKLDFPYTLAHILTAAEMAIILATIGAFVGEFLGGDKGLGRYAVNLQNNLQVPQLYGAIVIMALYGFALYASVSLVKRLLIPWHDSVVIQREAA
ncbi:ABC transporter permease [Pseudonocardia pini]|uniref:ABC transporter permease n=1 Tax=Pseudonocardia pini TaxID=2758030 RepID=UPI0015F05EF6|nr:ABC transporter permease [Pseudonocardia pini]